MSAYLPINPRDGKPLRLIGAFIRRTNLDHADLTGADMTRADLTGASARYANFKSAILKKAILHGVDLTGARNLTIEQLSEAAIDEETILPDGMDRMQIKRVSRASKGKLL